LKFSIISLENITDEQIVLTVVFDVKNARQDKLTELTITGSGLTDSLTNAIFLNFTGTAINIPQNQNQHHAPYKTVKANIVNPTCTTDGGYDEVVYCECGAVISRVKKVTTKLGHNYSPIWTTDLEPTYTKTGSKSHHCTRCSDKSDITEIPANGHDYYHIVSGEKVIYI
jgi:hypothetical protein